KRLPVLLDDEDRERSARDPQSFLGAEEAERGGVDLGDDPRSIEDHVSNGRPLEEGGVQVAGGFQGLLRLDELPLLRFELLLMDLEIVHEVAARGVVAKPRFHAVQVGNQLRPRHLVEGRLAHASLLPTSGALRESTMKAIRSSSFITRRALATRCVLPSGDTPSSSEKFCTWPRFGSSSSSSRRNDVELQLLAA